MSLALSKSRGKDANQKEGRDLFGEKLALAGQCGTESQKTGRPENTVLCTVGKPLQGALAPKHPISCFLNSHILPLFTVNHLRNTYIVPNTTFCYLLALSHLILIINHT